MSRSALRPTAVESVTDPLSDSRQTERATKATRQGPIFIIIRKIRTEKWRIVATIFTASARASWMDAKYIIVRPRPHAALGTDRVGSKYVGQKHLGLLSCCVLHIIPGYIAIRYVANPMYRDDRGDQSLNTKLPLGVNNRRAAVSRARCAFGGT